MDIRRGPSAKEIAYAGVKDLVTRADPREEFFLTEGEVAASLGVSRTPVREAFRSLEAERLLRIVPNRGAYVPPLHEREVVEVLEARTMIEVFCAQRVSDAGTDLSAALEELLAEQERLIDDAEPFIACDRRFHTTIVRAAGHSLFGDMYESLRDRQLRMGVQAVRSLPTRAEQVLREHRAIAEALAARDRDRILEAIHSHIDRTLGVLRTSIGQPL